MAKVRARLNPDGTVVQRRRDENWERIEPRADWARIDATTEAEIAGQAAADDAEVAREAALWARRVRRRTGLSQSKFAERIDVPVSTVRNWERGTHPPHGAARTLLRVIDRLPEIALAI
jgi:putative transcriptional regulator